MHFKIFFFFQSSTYVSKYCSWDQKIGSTYRKFHFYQFHLLEVPLIQRSQESLLMQIQGTAEIGSTKRQFHLSGVPLIESEL